MADNSSQIKPDVKEFQRIAAEAQAAFWSANERLSESNKRFLAADPTATSYYAISNAHTQAWNDWSEARRAMEEAFRKMHAKALEVAGIPKEHPLWELAEE